MKDPDAWLLDQLNHNELKHERGSLIDFQYLPPPPPPPHPSLVVKTTIS